MSYECSFAQRLPHRDKPFIVAPSAWELLPAGSHLEFVTTPKERAKAVVDSSAVVKLEEPSSSAEGGLRQASLPPSTIRSQAASSQTTSFHAPATPSNTDDSDLEVADSEDEPLSGFAGDGDEAGESLEVELSHHVAQRKRCASPSPSDLSSRYGRIKADVRRQLEENEDQEGSAGSSSHTHDSSGSARQPVDDGTPRAPRNSADSEASFRIGLDANGNVAFVAPSPAPWSPASRSVGSSRKGKERALDVAANSPVASSVKEEVSSPDGFPVASTSGTSSNSRPRTSTASGKASYSAASSGLAQSRSFPNLSFGSVSKSASSPQSTSDLLHPPHAKRARSSSPAAPPNKRLAPTLPRTSGASRDSPARPRSRQPSPYMATPPPPTPSHRSSAARKTWSDKRREALSRPRASIPPPGRSERFHYWIRLPNWPTAPRNYGPLKPRLIHKQQARGDVTLGLTLARVFDAAAEVSGWEVKDSRATFHVLDDAGKEQDVVVWGWDTILTEFCDLEEIGLEGKGDVIDFDYVPYRADRACYDLD